MMTHVGSNPPVSSTTITFEVLPMGATIGEGGENWQATSIGGRPALKTARTSAIGASNIVIVVELGQSKELAVTVPGLPSPSTFDQILSTFKFTSAVSTTSWKTYNSQALNITFRYPPDWSVKESNNYPGSTQGNDELRITKGSDVIYASAKRDCLEGFTYCTYDPKNSSYATWPSFSTISTNPDLKGIIDAIVSSVTHIR